jgi:cobalt-zinc-cadmium efflux system outer membrane protein
MSRIHHLALAIAGAALLVSGCANAPRARGSGAINDLVTAHGGPAAQWPRSDAPKPEADAELVAAKLQHPITVATAVDIAFLRSPAIRERYGELGISQADVVAASEIRKPTLGYVGLSAEGGGQSQITRSISVSFADLLFLPSRVRAANAKLEVTRQRMAANLLELQGDVESSWYEYVAALQSASMRESAARAAEASAEYARRLSAAGNLPPRSLALELAASSEARIAAARARATVSRARAQFAALLGLSSRDAWQVAARLPALPKPAMEQNTLVDTALNSRLDVQAARREAQLLESIARVARWWRWFGDIDVGYERETETDGAHLRGPTFSVGLPIFKRSGTLRAQAELEAARVRLDQLELSVRNDIALGLDRLATERDIAETYRAALIPQREAVTARTLEQVNFMLSGAFEALQARREQYEAYGAYIDAVRDYWLATVQLRLAVGGRLAGDDSPTGEVVELEAPEPLSKDDAHGEHK